MTEAEKEYAKAKGWIIFRGDYPLTEAMNEVFRKDWIRDCDIENLFSPPENMLTSIGKTVLHRLSFARDVLGIELSYDTLIQVFQKVKRDVQLGEDINNTLLHFQLQEAIRKEEYELAATLKAKLNLV